MLKRRIEALESAVRPAATVLLDLDALTADDRRFIAEIGISADSGQPDYSRLSVPELRRLAGIAEQYGATAGEA